jgi:cyclopropane fatty-acyl-phospholipid synthase-like methyltransferase
MHSRGLALLPKVAQAIDLTQARQVLDVGSGAGTLSRLLAERYTDTRFTLLDLPAITDIARELTAAHPAAGRITHLAGDYFKAPLPGPVDTVIYCGALHQHDPAAARSLLSRLSAALRPGGKLIVVDLLADPTRSGPAFSLLFGLNMSLVSPSSHLHSTPEVEAYLRNAGLNVTHPLNPPGSLYTVVTGTAQG